MTRPDVDAVLAPLKPFQRRTVDHAFDRLFTAPDSTARFLVADEVGLGKTLVARGIIARAIDHLWDDVERIDIIYICSNQSIARANLPKLHVSGSGERSFSLATRLTLLATELAPKAGQLDLIGSKLNFVSFTPGTSFDMGHSGGKWKERVVLFRLLQPVVDGRTGLVNLLQGTMGRSNWRWHVENEETPIHDGIRDQFQVALASRPDLRAEIDELIATWFFRFRESWPEEANSRRSALIGALRRLLAGVCVQALEPDLVILDEFQRFKSLLETRSEQRDPAAELAQALFDAPTPEGHPVRTLLLSATPYKLYTADAEIEHEDHYADFLATTRFLLRDDETRVDLLKRQLSRFGTELKRAAAGAAVDVAGAKHDIEASLGAIMARTERTSANEARDAMIAEDGKPARLTTSDVRHYMAADALFRAVGDRDPMPFWKSAPYLANFMRGYKVNERLTETLDRSPEKVVEVLRAHAGAFLSAHAFRNWEELEAGNAKLRELLRDLVESGLWALLWIPPTIPYWELEGAFAEQEGRTKTLLFSAWNVVPDVVSAVLSYEAERRMAGGRLRSYADPGTQQVQLLRLTQSSTGARARHRLFLLLFPCLTLADEAHPLRARPGGDRRVWVRQRVEALLDRLPSPADGDVDERWEWAAPLLLDPALLDTLLAWPTEGEGAPPNPELFGAYLADFQALDPSALGRRPEGLVDLVTDVALGAPGVLAARMLGSARIGSRRLDDVTRRRLAVSIADAFWRLFNRPTVITLLNQSSRTASREEGVYWRMVLRYCQDGNLQAVLDEHFHMLWEQRAWSETETVESVAAACAEDIVHVVEPTPSRVHAHFMRLKDGSTISQDTLRVRTDFALRFGDARTDDTAVTQDGVRRAFNSPFRPFVLASTSIGQEGLDFHPWSHHIVHWDLPGNPVDLEQREGRVHRYKGHAVRRNVAHVHATEALSEWKLGDDLWSLLFDLATRAARTAGASDLVPHWMAPGPWRVRRHVPMLPYTKEVEAFARLKRQLAAYRVVFGQPRQEELVTLLDSADVDVETLKAWAVDLAPR